MKRSRTSILVYCVNFEVHSRNYDILFNHSKTYFLLAFSVSSRLEPGFQQVKDPDSSRSVFITSAEANEADIEVSQPSDCLLLQRDHVQCSHLEELTVCVGYGFTNNINGPPEPQTPDTWKEALHHLLDTYRPTYLFLDTNGSHTGIENGHKVELADGTSYISFWNESQSLLSITRYDYERSYTALRIHHIAS